MKRRTQGKSLFSRTELFYWQCELFWIGMNELGLLRKDNWQCELFQIGLKEVGLVA